MDADHLVGSSKNPPNIVGIFNYCDRWCERCLFTNRCLHYQSRSRTPHVASETEAFKHALEQFSSDLRLTHELITRKMVEFGIPLPSDQQVADVARYEDAREQRVWSHPIVRASLAYGDLVGAWFAAERDTLLAHAEHLRARAEGAADAEALVMEAGQVKHALQIIQHDRWFITPKLSRALHGREWDAAYPDADRDPVQNDSNGSVKVALVSIDRSEASWRLIGRWLEDSDTAVLVAESLARLRAEVETEFPQARAFVRPGLDELYV
jgi:hypothetical protein